MLPFAINSRQWLDGATSEHWLALPGESAATLYAEGKPVAGLVYWHHFRMHFPKDAVLVRTISLNGRRVETQLLHFEGADWRAYTYAWRDDQSDADLVPADGGEARRNTTAETVAQRGLWSESRLLPSIWSPKVATRLPAFGPEVIRPRTEAE